MLEVTKGKYTFCLSSDTGLLNNKVVCNDILYCANLFTDGFLWKVVFYPKYEVDTTKEWNDYFINDCYFVFVLISDLIGRNIL